MTNQHVEKNIGDYIAIFKRYRVRAILTTVLIFIIAVALAFLLPPVFRSTATILIEQQEIPQDLVRSTITSFADERIQVISQRVMTRANLLEIVKKYNLYEDERNKEPNEVILDMMRKDIQMNTVSADVVDPRSGRPTQATIAFTLSFDSKSPELAQKVSNELVSLYLNENLKSRTEMAAQTSDFLSDETAKLSAHISALEQQLADFKKINNGILPEQLSYNFQIVDRTEREISDVDRDIRALKERETYLVAQLAQLSPSIPQYGKNGERVLSASDRLKQLQTNYVSMAATYGETYPDLIRTRKEIEALKKETGVVSARDELSQQLASLQDQLRAAERKYADQHPEILRLKREIASTENTLKVEDRNHDNDFAGRERPDNPAFIQIQSQLEATRIDLGSQLKKREELSKKIADFEDRIAKGPQVEREYRELTRDYDNAWAKYKELKDKQMEAKLAQVMETERKGERFTLIEPPEFPEKPIKPNRLVIVILGLLFSIVAGAIVAVISDVMDHTVRGAKAVRLLLGESALATIPYIEIEEERQVAKRKYAFAAGSGGVMLIAAIISIHYFFKPLDVLWYALLRRYGLG